MEVTVNIEDLVKSLEEAQKIITRKLEGMVQGFAYTIAYSAILNTPIGDSQAYASYYAARTDLPQEEGLAKGNWQYTDSGAELKMIFGLESDKQALNDVKATAAYYQLGDSFSIANSVPYIGILEGGYKGRGQGSKQAPNGIMQPTVDMILSTYKVDLQKYYNES